MKVGSSPLARGLRLRVVDGGEDGRIIPARAGFTLVARHREVNRKDHPRSRGVYANTNGCRADSMGSSPLARGLQAQIISVPKSRRIIPARAGFTAAPLFCADSLADHPRSRGVYTYFHNLAFDGTGSSPLARGLQGCSRPLNCWAGIIPARAGFTVRPGSSDGSGEDHPRSRGVYPFNEGQGAGYKGSSPLARGLRR